MLLLLFSTHKERYAINCEHITEVIPFLDLQPIPMTPPYVAGAVNYRGTPLPIINLSQLLDGSDCRNMLSTRIILIDYEIDRIRGKMTIGLLAEKVIETIKTPTDWLPDQKKDAPYFIDSSIVAHEMIQWFEPVKMLSNDVLKDLFMEHATSQEHQ